MERIPPVRLFVNTSLHIFGSWLTHATRDAPSQPTKTERGRIIAQVSGIVRRGPAGLTVFGMEGFYEPDAPDKPYWPMSPVIEFEVMPVSRDRLQVTARCNQPVMAAYFNRLLTEIGQAWPDATSSQSAPATAQRRQTQLEGKADPPRKPTRSQDRANKRKLQVNDLTNQGLTRGEIAAKLGVSVSTVDNDLGNRKR